MRSSWVPLMVFSCSGMAWLGYVGHCRRCSGVSTSYCLPAAYCRPSTLTVFQSLQIAMSPWCQIQMWSSVSLCIFSHTYWQRTLIIPVLLFFSLLSLFTSFVGLTGTLLSSRPILAFYNLLLWPTFISLALVGYTSFKRSNLQLDRKLNQVWSQFLNDQDRLRIQNELGCCGYYNPYRKPDYASHIPFTGVMGT